MNRKFARRGQRGCGMVLRPRPGPPNDQYDVDAVRFQGVPDPLRSSFGNDHIGDHCTIALDQAADHWSVAVDLRIFWGHHDPHPRTLNDIDAYQACADQHADVRRGQLRAGRYQQRTRSRHGTLRSNIFSGRDRLYALHEIGRLWFSQPQRDHSIYARGGIAPPAETARKGNKRGLYEVAPIVALAATAKPSRAAQSARGIGCTAQIPSASTRAQAAIE